MSSLQMRNEDKHFDIAEIDCHCLAQSCRAVGHIPIGSRLNVRREGGGIDVASDSLTRGERYEMTKVKDSVSYNHTFNVFVI